MKKNWFSLCLVFVVLEATGGQYYPDEFKDFFVETPQKITISIAGDSESDDVIAIVNYDKFRLDINSTSFNEFKYFLQRKGLNNSAIESVLNDAINGIKTDDACQERLSRCVLDTNDGVNKYVFDFDNASLRLYIAPKNLRRDLESTVYESSINDQHALINWSNIYASTDDEGRDSLTWNNETTIGLPLGYLSLDTEYSSSNKEFEVYSALYDMEYEDKRFMLGRNRYNVSFNSTDYLNNGATYASDAVHFASSRNMVKGGDKSQQRIYFYAPQNGRLEVYRDERLILNKTVTEGKQSISYSELPKGVYDITILLSVSGTTVLTETRQVVNNNQFTLPLHGLDYVIGGGQFTKRDTNNSTYDDFDRNYGRGMLNLRPTEFLMLGVGAVLSKDENFYQVGMSINPNEYSTLDYVGGMSDGHNQFHMVSIGVAPFFADARRLKLSDEHFDYGLINQLFGENGYSDYGVGISGDIFGGNGYLRLSRYESEYSDIATLYGSAKDTSFKMLSSGWFYHLPQGSLSLNVNYIDANYADDELRMSLTYTLKLGDGLSSQFGLYSDENGFESNKNYLLIDNRSNNWYSNVSVGASVERENQVSSDISGNISGNNAYVKANGYAYANDKGTKNLSAGLSFTQIVSRDGIDVTHEKGRSFAKINQYYDGEQHEEDLVAVTVRKGQTINRNRYLNEDTVIKVDDYQSLELRLEGNENNVEIQGHRLNAFVLPGSVYQLDASIIDLFSQVVVLDDIHGSPINSLQCVGRGCVNVEPLSNDGVYRVNYKRDFPYQLISRKGICVYDSADNMSYAKGYCLPGLEKESQQNWQATSGLFDIENSHDLLVFLGRFEIGEEVRLVQQKLEQQAIEYKKIEVANEVFIYLKEGQDYTQAQKKILRELDAYVMLRETEIDLFSYGQNLGTNDDV